MTEKSRHYASTKDAATQISLLTIALIAAFAIDSPTARSALPGQFRDGEIPAGIRKCVEDKHRIEDCDPRQMERDPTQSQMPLLQHVYSDLEDQLNQLRIDSLANDLQFDVPIKTEPKWYGTVDVHLIGKELAPYEISTDPVRAEENTQLMKQSPDGRWVRLGIELGPRFDFGFHPRTIDNNPTKSFTVSVGPQYEWNIYETRWNALPRKYESKSILDPLKKDAKLIEKAPKETEQAIKTYYSIPADQLGEEFLPGEMIEVERYGAASMNAAPVVQLLKFSKLAPLTLGGFVTAGFTEAQVFHYYRCGIEVIDQNRSLVTYTRMIRLPQPWWQKMFGASSGFIVGLGPLIDLSFIDIAWLPFKWQPVSWSSYGMQTDVFAVDRTGIGGDGWPVARALDHAYREGNPEGLFAIAQASEESLQEGSGTRGVVHLESDVRLSSRTATHTFDLTAWAHSRPEIHSDFERTRFHGDVPSATDAPVSVRTLTNEFQLTGHGTFASNMLDIAIRTAAKPVPLPISDTSGKHAPKRKAKTPIELLPLNEQVQSLRLTSNFKGRETTRDEMIQFLAVAQGLAASAIAGNPDPTSVAAAQDAANQIATELIRVRALGPHERSKATCYFYIDIDPTAFDTVLGSDRASEYLDAWLKIYGFSSELPAKWASFSADERYAWLDEFAKARDDHALRDHLKAAWIVIEAAVQAQQLGPNRSERAKVFLGLIRKEHLDLYPFAALAAMAGSPEHLFAITHLKLAAGKENFTEISFGGRGSLFEVPNTVEAAGRF